MTLFTLDIKYKKTILIYLVLSIVAITVNSIYGIFGHGVHSVSMTWMFLYPLLAGALFYLVVAIFIPKVNEIRGYRLFFNCYNSGVATLTIGSFLKGILDIAGTSSIYTVFFVVAGWLFILVALIMLLIFTKGKKTH